MTPQESSTDQSPRPEKRAPSGARGSVVLGKKQRPAGFKGFLAQFWSRLWRVFVTGAMVWVPTIVTLWVTWLVIARLGFGVDNLVKRAVERLNGLGDRVEFLRFLTLLSYRPGFGFLFVVAVFLTTGLVTRYLVARKIIRFGEGIVERIPLISSVYRAVQQIRDVFIRREGTVFQRVCLIQFPRPGMYAVGFITSVEEGPVQKTIGKELIAVFMPTTPNPTSGYLMYLPPEEIIDIDMSVEDAMKLIISGGAYVPSSSPTE
jgi:uncharacterized membrane protein